MISDRHSSIINNHIVVAFNDNTTSGVDLLERKVENCNECKAIFQCVSRNYNVLPSYHKKGYYVYIFIQII